MAATDRIDSDDLGRWISGDDLSALFTKYGMPMSPATIATKGRGRAPRGSGPLYRINNRKAEYHVGRALEWRRSLIEYHNSSIHRTRDQLAAGKLPAFQTELDLEPRS